MSDTKDRTAFTERKANSFTYTVNGEVRTALGEFTVFEMLQAIGCGGQPVAVERNGHVVPKARHQTVTLADADTIEVVTIVGGG